MLEKNKGIEGIVANPDFQDWLDLVPKAELDLIQAKIVGMSRLEPNWKEQVCDLVVEYQALHRAIFDLTTIRLKAAETARKEMKESES